MWSSLWLQFVIKLIDAISGKSAGESERIGSFSNYLCGRSTKRWLPGEKSGCFLCLKISSWRFFNEKVIKESTSITMPNLVNCIQKNSESFQSEDRFGRFGKSLQECKKFIELFVYAMKWNETDNWWAAVISDSEDSFHWPIIRDDLDLTIWILKKSRKVFPNSQWKCLRESP